MFLTRNIQIKTEDALKVQINLASSEKDFNAALQLAGIYHEQISDIRSKYLEPGDQFESQIKLLNDKRDALMNLIDGEYDSLIDRMINIRSKYHCRTKFNYFGFDFELSYRSSSNNISVDITRVDGMESFAFNIDGKGDVNFLLERRSISLYYAEIKTRRIIDHHLITSEWVVDVGAK